jgi:hypothetical protein
MTPTTFPCPFCGRKMGVGAELLGHKVRCPHCKQVILAPATGGAATAPVAVVPAPAVKPVAPLPATTPGVAGPAPGLPTDLPVFNLPSQEAKDSIFGEAPEEGDDVFGNNQGSLPVPVLPPPVAVVPPPPPAATRTRPLTAVPAPAAYPVPAPVAADPFAGFTAAAAYTPPAPVPVAIPAVPVAAAPPAAVPVAYSAAPPANPWAGFDQSPPPAPPQAIHTAPPAVAFAAPPQAVTAADPEPFPAAAADEPPVEPRRGSHDGRPSREDRRSRPERGRPAEKSAGGGAAGLIKIGFFLLIPYAFLMTILAVYGLFIREGGKVPDGHPLSLIPDTRGEFPPADRKKTGKLGVPLDGPLPPELRAGLGKKVAVGAVEVEPVSVAIRKLTITKARENGKTDSVQTQPAVVLTLNVKNTSSDLSFHPLDPAFNRKEFPSDSPPTALVVGKSTFAGGAVKWPFEKGLRRSYEAAQEDEDKPLGPGESRQYVVTSDAKPDVRRAVQNAKDTILWRVQVRRGLVEFRGREVPVTALVGVEFKASDVTAED